MKLMKSVALMAMGAGVILAYKKYKEPVMDCIKKKIDMTEKELNQLENRME